MNIGYLILSDLLKAFSFDLNKPLNFRYFQLCPEICK